MKTLVLYAHPDRWTIGAEFPPEERARMRRALLGFSWEWLGARRGRVRMAAPKKARVVEDTAEQREALAAWKGRGTKVTREVLASGLEAVLTGALWESPEFRRAESKLAFHRAWRILLDVDPAARPGDLETLTARWNLIPRSR